MRTSYLSRADSFFWRKDVEDNALARYSIDGSAGTRPGEAADDAAQSSESFEEVLIEEPGTERHMGSEVASGTPEDEMPMSVQAGGITLCSHDYPAGPAAAAGRFLSAILGFAQWYDFGRLECIEKTLQVDYTSVGTQGSVKRGLDFTGPLPSPTLLS
ncbi:hypothetical protein AK812_SmicGene43739 [Symbiodinium microadriaticum]|uniref:Uncharacterized protein n=1 Tax=Symbiodinium microadriaticum TaxID=2951 RepID=A0A1Q9C095_SYMMI|nr:hypothetical protein AK812_SmicGene43739 [Symbiodinium microadriaticum]CAE7281355.1 unnamed protein product [Symbiodinium microadriaticum]CAE7317205.1 unnamed protein product [Symbiodinium sp. KB8]